MRSTRQNLVIIGASGHAKVVADIVEKEKKFKLLGFIDDRYSLEKKFMGYPLLGKVIDFAAIIARSAPCLALIAIGDNYVRHDVHTRLLQQVPDYHSAIAIHPSAQVATDVKLGDGTVVMANAVINASATIGKHCIVNTSSSLDHDGNMADFSSLAPHAAVGGNVSIGSFSALGIASCVKHGLTIGEHSVLGAGSTLLTSMGDRQVYYGSPAKLIRDRVNGQKYL